MQTPLIDKQISRYWLCLTALLGIAILMAFTGISILPLESHESYVLVAAQNMYDRHNWITPWFNGDYRLNKPPINYWATAFIAWLFGEVQHIQPWHGRAVSALAGVGVVVLTYVIGKQLFDKRVAFLASLMLASSTGFYAYTHSARPEMLYAFFCTLALMAFIQRRETNITEKKRQYFAYLIWIAFALATLTKGPQLPAMFLAVFLIDFRLRRLSLAQALEALRPISGVLIFTVIALPWFWIIRQKIPESVISHSQLSGTLLAGGIKNILDPYYFYRPLQLMLPWVLLLPVIIFYYYKFKINAYLKQSNGLRLLFLLILVPVILLNFGPQKRWYYMLPCLPVMFLIFSAMLLVVFQNFFEKNVSRLKYLLVILPVICILVLGYIQNKKNVFGEDSLAKMVAQQEYSAYKLIAFEESPSIYVYYARRNVEHVSSMQELLSIKSKTEKILLIINSQRIKDLPLSLRPLVIKTTQDGSGDKVSLVQIMS